jgi:hypothetical protein
MIKARRGTLRVPEYDPYFADHLPPVPDLPQRLTWEHRQIEKLWNDLQRLHHHDGTSPLPRAGLDTEAAIAQKLVQALADHEATEITALYPAAARAMTPAWADAAQAEHAELHALLDQVEGQDPADPAVFEVFDRVMSRMVAHMNEEDNVVFPVMRVASSREDLVNPEGCDFLGLPAGKTMIAVTPGVRPRALGTGSRAVRQTALEAGRPAAEAPPEPQPEPQPENEPDLHAEPEGDGEAEIDIRDDIRDDARAGEDAPGAGGGGTEGGEDATGGTTKTRARRLLRRR